MYFYIHKGRHIVMSETGCINGEAKVVWIGLNPEFSGVRKRGRRPNYNKPVCEKELALIEKSDIIEELRRRVEVIGPYLMDQKSKI